MNNLLSFEQIKAKLESWCAYQDRCISEYNKKITNYSLSENEKFILLKHLIDNNFINEKRYVEAIISGKKSLKKWGRNKILYFLKNKQINVSLYIDLLNNIDDEIYEKNISKLISQKKNTLSKNISEYESKNKIIRFLLQKGFSFDEIQNHIDKLNS